MKKPFLLTIVLLFLGSVAFAQKTKDTPGTAAVKSANNKISSLLAKKAPAAKVTKAVRSFLDIDTLGQQAMVNHWSSLTEKQQKQFLDTLHKLIEANYVKGMNANLKYKTDYTGDTLNPNGERTVNTVIHTTRHGHPYTIKVDYTLKQSGKSWKAYDVTTDGSSLIDNYKSMFDKVIDKDGFDGLLQKMQKKLDDLNSANDATAATDTGDTATTTQ